MMKTRSILLFIIIIMMTIIFLSCRTKKELNSLNYIVVYDNLDACREFTMDGMKGIYATWGVPTILILKSDWEQLENNSYESYFLGELSFIGKWQIEGDTLSLFPLYKFYYDSIPSVTKIEINNPDYLMQGMLNHKWVIKGNRIYEKADYSLHDEYDETGSFIGSVMRPTSNPNNNLRLRSKTKLK